MSVKVNKSPGLNRLKTLTRFVRQCNREIHVIAKTLPKIPTLKDIALANDKLALALIILVEKQNGLLYRTTESTYDQCQDFLLGNGQSRRVSRDAAAYVDDVLYNRLDLAPGKSLTNMHYLLLAILRLGPSDEGWPQANMERNEAQITQASLSNSFIRIKHLLKNIINNLGSHYSKALVRCRAQQGSVKLSCLEQMCEVPEEVNLADILCSIMTIPIIPPAHLPLHANDGSEHIKKYFSCLISVIRSLDRRYATLRGLGLSPRQYLNFQALSDGDLRQLSQLKRQAHELIKEEDKFNESKIQKAWEQAFNIVKGEHKHLAHCESFRHFYYSHVGETLMGLSLVQEDQYDQETENDQVSLIMKILFHLQEKHPKLLDNPTFYFFTEAYIHDRDDIEVIEDKKFLEHATRHSFWKEQLATHKALDELEKRRQNLIPLIEEEVSKL